MRGRKLVITVLLCASTSAFAGLKERVIAACQDVFSNNQNVFQCVQSTADINLIKHCGYKGGSEARVLRCIQNGGGGSYDDYGPVYDEPVYEEPVSTEAKRIKRACKDAMSFSSNVRECKQTASSVDAVQFCDKEYTFDSEVLGCLEIVADSVNETKKIKVIEACNDVLRFDSSKEECIDIAKNARVVERCGDLERFDSNILQCIERKSR